ncbi:MAG TPA: hypothetical protein VNE71_15815, partial [Myxococcota bacterium]|nr:hypothetical protein [Myxococcota bacterium]
MRFFLTLGCAGVLLLALAAAAESPAEADLRAARAQIEAAPDAAARARGLVALAAAHTRRAREVGDATHYERSLEALAEAQRLDPSHAQLAKVEAWVRLGRHEFAEAEALAHAYCDAHPDDPDGWALLGDARMELGRDDAAADAYQRMMDLRPGPGAYLRASYWRERARRRGPRLDPRPHRGAGRSCGRRGARGGDAAPGARAVRRLPLRARGAGRARAPQRARRAGARHVATRTGRGAASRAAARRGGRAARARARGGGARGGGRLPA